jgi:hypothetical protein
MKERKRRRNIGGNKRQLNQSNGCVSMDDILRSSNVIHNGWCTYVHARYLNTGKERVLDVVTEIRFIQTLNCDRLTTIVGYFSLSSS